MSQVMPSPLLAGGHAVRLPPCEEPRRVLHPAPSPNLPPQCPYYTTEGWGAQALMASMPCKEPPNKLQQAPQARANASCLLRAPGEQPSGALEDLDSYIGFSLESLNQMILELDPTFQLLPTAAGGPWAEPTQSTTSQRKKEEPEALGKDQGRSARRGAWGPDLVEKELPVDSEEQEAVSCGEMTCSLNYLLSFSAFSATQKGKIQVSLTLPLLFGS